MSIVITTPTGNIGSVIVNQLLAAGEKPVLIARDPAKVQDAVNRGATVIQGTHDDADLLTEATKGADALFVLTPPDYTINDINGYYRGFAQAAATAAKANSISHVVHLSSVGADLESGNGPVAGLNAAEQVLNAAGIPNLTHLRPGYFMENTLSQIPNIQQAGSLFTTFEAGTRFPMIATKDIGARAAELLHDRSWTGHQIVELQGPEMGYEAVAETLTEVLERKISHVTVTDEQLVEALTGMGLSRVIAESLAELSNGIATGRVRYLESGSVETTPTTYREFAQEVFRPAFGAAATA